MLQRVIFPLTGGDTATDPEHIKNNAVPHQSLALRASAACLGLAPLCLRMKDSCV